MLVILSIIAGGLGILGILGILAAQAVTIKQNAIITANLQGIVQFVNNLFNKPDKDTDPAIYQIITLSADLTGQRVATSLMNQNRATVAGSMKGVNAALKNEAVAAYPDLAIADALEKALPKNPLAQAGLGILINRVLSGGGLPGLGSGGSASPAAGSSDNGQSAFKF